VKDRPYVLLVSRKPSEGSALLSKLLYLPWHGVLPEGYARGSAAPWGRPAAARRLLGFAEDSLPPPLSPDLLSPSGLRCRESLSHLLLSRSRSSFLCLGPANRPPSSSSLRLQASPPGLDRRGPWSFLLLPLSCLGVLCCDSLIFRKASGTF